MKTCSRCGCEQDTGQFGRDKSRADGLSYWCKLCSKKKNLAWVAAHSEVVLAAGRRWGRRNAATRARYSERYRAAHPAEVRRSRRAYEAMRYEQDPGFRLTKCLRSRVTHALTNGQKAGSAVRDLGCSIPELRAWLEAKFQPGMTWINHGEWHIDHVKPLAKFDLTDRDQFLEACHYTNLQPLWAEENIAKRDRDLQAG